MENSVEDIRIDDKTLKISQCIVIAIIMIPILEVIFINFILKYDNTIWVQMISFIPIALAMEDHKLWKKEGIKICSFWWAVLFFPYYLWKRDKVLKEKSKNLFRWWLAGIIFFVLFLVNQEMQSDQQSTLEQTACELTSRIFKEQLNSSNTCKSVTIIESKGDTHDAFAEMENGRTIRIQIKEIGSGKIYVQVLE